MGAGISTAKSKVNLKKSLQEHFGFDAFKGEQEKIIKSILSGKDTFVIMPTGGGNIGNCVDFLDAGAEGLGMGGRLFDKARIRNKDWMALSTALAQRIPPMPNDLRRGCRRLTETGRIRRTTRRTSPGCARASVRSHRTPPARPIRTSPVRRTRAPMR